MSRWLVAGWPFINNHSGPFVIDTVTYVLRRAFLVLTDLPRGVISITCRSIALRQSSQIARHAVTPLRALLEGGVARDVRGRDEDGLLEWEETGK